MSDTALPCGLRGYFRSGIMQSSASNRTEPLESSPSDEMLAERVRRSDDTMAFGQLVERYRTRLVALARRMLASGSGIGGDAEDVAQEVFVAAYDKRASYRTGTSFRSWLYRIAVNRCLDRLRARARYPAPHRMEDLPEPIEPDSDPLHAVLAEEWEARLRQAVAALPPKYRAVFILRHLDDLSYEEIAAATDLPLGTVKTHLFPARAQLRRELTGYLDR